MKIKVKNYQAIKEADLTFEPGVTVIVGSSNNGKSSIIRAIEAAINNKGGSDFINYDADACDVIIEDNGHVIQWHKERKSAKSYYQLNNEKLNKIGQKQIEEVGVMLNMPEIVVNNDKFRLNFWKQLDFPFLVGKTHYQLFDFISKSKDQELMANLLDMTDEQAKNSKSELSDINAQINTRIQDINAVQAEIQDLSKYEQFDIEKFKKLSDISSSIDYKIYKYGSANEKYDELKANIDTINATINKKQNMLESAKTFINEIGQLNNQIQKIENVLMQIESNNQKVKAAKETQQRLEAKQLSLKKELQTFDVCPFCHQPLNNNHGGLHE